MALQKQKGDNGVLSQKSKTSTEKKKNILQWLSSPLKQVQVEKSCCVKESIDENEEVISSISSTVEEDKKMIKDCLIEDIDSDDDDDDFEPGIFKSSRGKTKKRVRKKKIDMENETPPRKTLRISKKKKALENQPTLSSFYSKPNTSASKNFLGTGKDFNNEHEDNIEIKLPLIDEQSCPDVNEGSRSEVDTPESTINSKFVEIDATLDSKAVEVHPNLDSEFVEVDTTLDSKNAEADIPDTNTVEVDISDCRLKIQKAKNTTFTEPNPTLVIESPLEVKDVSALLMASGRPKRQAVMKSESQKQKSMYYDDSDFEPLKKSKKKTTNKRVKKLDGDEEYSNTASGNKREKGKKTKKTSFFLDPIQKRVLMDIEAMKSFKEDIARRRKIDEQFFSGKEVNPFFTKERSSSLPMAITIEQEENDQVFVQWQKNEIVFPTQSHIFDETEGIKGDFSILPFLSKKHVKLPLSLPMKTKVIIDLVNDIASGWLFSIVKKQIRCKETELVFNLLSKNVDDASKVTLEQLSLLYGVSIARLERMWSCVKEKSSPSCNSLWVDNYAPRRFDELLGKRQSNNKATLGFLTEWLKEWKNTRIVPETIKYTEDDLNYHQNNIYDRGVKKRKNNSKYSDESDFDDEDDEQRLYKVLILQGELGAGKSCSVYACAEELGYEIIEINTGQERSGKKIIEIAWEATRSNRVVNNNSTKNIVVIESSSSSNEDDMMTNTGSHKRSRKKKKRSMKRKKKKKRNATTSSFTTLSLILLEDVDILFEQDKGFMAALSTISKDSKCPIIITCKELPVDLPTNALSFAHHILSRPGEDEIMCFLSLICRHQKTTISTSLLNQIFFFYNNDLRRTIHFLQFYSPILVQLHDKQERLLIADENFKNKECLDLFHCTYIRQLRCHYPPVLSVADIKSATVRKNVLVEDDDQKESQDLKEENKITLETMWEMADFSSFSDILYAKNYHISPTGPENRTASYSDVDGEDDVSTSKKKELGRSVNDALRNQCWLYYEKQKTLFRYGVVHASNVEENNPIDIAVQTVKLQQKWEQRRHELHFLVEQLEIPPLGIGCQPSGYHMSLDYVPLLGKIIDCDMTNQKQKRRTKRNYYLREVVSTGLLDTVKNFSEYSGTLTD